MHCVYLVLWTRKVLYGNVLCAIYKFSFIQSYTHCYGPPTQQSVAEERLRKASLTSHLAGLNPCLFVVAVVWSLAITSCLFFAKLGCRLPITIIRLESCSVLKASEVLSAKSTTPQPPPPPPTPTPHSQSQPPAPPSPQFPPMPIWAQTVQTELTCCSKLVQDFLSASKVNYGLEIWHRDRIHSSGSVDHKTA